MIIPEFIKWLVPFVCGAVISALVAHFKKKSALEDGVQCLLRAEIIKAHDKYTERGYCPVAMKEALSKEYNAYHNLGGNDVATGLYEELMKLPKDLSDDMIRVKMLKEQETRK